MKEQENLRLKTVSEALAFLFEVTFVPLERCDFYVLLGLLAQENAMQRPMRKSCYRQQSAKEVTTKQKVEVFE